MTASLTNAYPHAVQTIRDRIEQLYVNQGNLSNILGMSRQALYQRIQGTRHRPNHHRWFESILWLPSGALAQTTVSGAPLKLAAPMRSRVGTAITREIARVYAICVFQWEETYAQRLLEVARMTAGSSTAPKA